MRIHFIWRSVQRAQPKSPQATAPPSLIGRSARCGVDSIRRLQEGRAQVHLPPLEILWSVPFHRFRFPWRRRRSCTDRQRPRRPTAGLEPTQFHPHAGCFGALSWVTQRYDSDPSEPGPRGSCTLVVKSCPYEMRSDRNMFGWTSGQLTDVFYLRKQ